MSRTIDERVVSMEFDNKRFESNVRTSIGTLDKLKQSLNFQGAAKSLESINAAAKKCNFSPLSSAIDTVGLKFSALYTIADQTLRNIVNSVQRTATQIVKAFTIDPVKTGLQEYETQIGAVQTILANTQSKGTTLDDVNAALDQLNTYADKTIYNFTEMTRNIGTFTAAGVDLDTSVNAIQGIANLAAISGSTSQQASTAMYQLSQALASGTIRLMDWNSVVNAGMGGQVFQDALLETARVHGIAVDDMIKRNGSFRESLSEGWLTADILTETLMKFTMTTEGLTAEQIEANRAMLKGLGYTDEQIDGIFKLGETATDAATKVKTFSQLMDTLKESAQSGWTQTWELLIGDFEQAKELWTGVSEVIGGFIEKTSKSRNDLLEGALTSNYDKLMKKLNEAGITSVKLEESLIAVGEKHGINVKGLIEEYGSLEDAIRSGAITLDLLKEAITGIEKSTADLSLVDRILGKGKRGEDVKQVQQALLDLGYDLGEFGVDGIIGNYTEAAIKAFQEANGLKVTGIVDEETLAALEKATTSLNNFDLGILDIIGDLDQLGGRELLIESFKNIFDGLKSVMKPISSAFKSIFPPLTAEKLYSLIEGFANLTEKFKLNDKQAGALRKAFQGVFAVVDIFWRIIKTVAGGLAKILGPILAKVGNGILGIGEKIGNAIVKFRAWLIQNNVLQKAFDGVVSILGKAKDKLSEWFKSLMEIPQVRDAVKKVLSVFKNLQASFNELKGLSFEELVEKFKVLKDKIVNIFANSDIVTSIKEKFVSAGTAMKNWIRSFIKNPDIPIGIKKLVVGFVKFWDKILHPPEGWSLESFISLFESLKEKIINLFSNSDIWNSIKEAFSSGDIWGGIKAVFSGIKDGLSKLIASIKEKFASVSESFGSAKDGIETFVEFIKSKIPMVLGILGGIGLIIGIKKILDIGKSVGDFLSGIKDSVTGVFESLSGALDSITKKNEAAALKTKSEALKNVALSILIISGAVFVFAKAIEELGAMDWKTLAKGGGVALVILAALVGSIVGLMAATKLIGDGNIASFGAMMISMAASLLLFSASVAIIGNMNVRELKRGGLAVTIFLGMMVGMMAATKLLGGRTGDSRLLGSTISDFGKMMSGLVVALLVMAVVVKILGKMDNGELIKGGLAISVFLGMMVGMMAATKLLARRVPEFGSTMIKFAGALLLMTAAVAILGNMKTTTLVKGGIVIAAFLGMMVGMMAATKLIGRRASNAAKVGAMMLSFAGAILLMTASIAILGKMETDTLVKGGAVIVAFLGMMVGMMAATQLIGRQAFNATKVGLMMLAFSGALLVMAGSVKLLSTIGTKDLIMATLCIAVLGGMFEALVLSTKAIKPKSLGVIITLAVTIAVLAGALKLLTDIDSKTLLIAAASLSGTIAALSASALMLGQLGKIGPKAFIGVGVLAGILAVVGGFVAIGIASLPTIGDKLSEFMESLQPFLNGVKGIRKSSVEGIALLSEAVLSLTTAGFLYAVGNFYSFGGVSRSLDSFTEFIKGVLPTIQTFAKDLSASNLDINMDNVRDVIGIVKSLAEAAGLIPGDTFAVLGTKFGGGMYLNVSNLKAFGEFITSVVPIIQSFATDLSVKGLNVNGKNIQAVVGAVTTLAEAASAAPAIEIGGAFGKFSGFTVAGGFISIPGLTGFKNFIEGVLPVMKDFVVDISGVKINSSAYSGLGKMCEAIKVLAEAADAAPGVDVAVGLAKFTGGAGIGTYINFTSLDNFKQFIVGVLPAMEGFVVDISGIKANAATYDNIVSLCEAIKVLAEAADAAPDTTIAAGLAKFKGGIGAGVYFNKENVEGFKAFIEAAIPAVSGFAVDLSEVKIDKSTVENVKSLCEAVKILAEAADAAPDEKAAVALAGFGGGAGVGAYFESTDLEGFLKFVKDVSPVIESFASSLPESGINVDAYANVKTLCEAVKILGEGAGSLNTNTIGAGVAAVGPAIAVGGAYSYTDLKSFAEWLTNVAPIVSDFAIDLSSDEVKIDGDAVKAVAEAAKALAEGASFAPTTTTAITFIGGMTSSTDIAAFAEWIEKVAPIVSDFALDLSGSDISVDAESVKAVAEAGKALAEGAKSAPITETKVGAGLISFTATTDLQAVADWIESMAEVIKNFSLDVSSDSMSIDTETITAVAMAGKTLAEMAAIIPKDTGSLFDIFAFNTNYDDFSTNLKSFGEAIAGFSGAVAGKIDTSALIIAANAGLILAQMVHQLAYYQEFMGMGMTTGDFKTKTGEIADALVDFAGKFSGVNLDAIDTASSAASKIANAFTNLSQFDYSTVNTAELKIKLEEVAQAIRDFSTNTAEVDPSGAVAKITGFIDKIIEICNSDFAGASTFKDTLRSIGQSGVDGFLEPFASSAETAKTATTTLMTSFKEGIDENDDDVFDTLTSALDVMIDDVEAAETDFYNAGVDLVEGFADGIDENTWMAEAKARAMAKAALEAAKEALDSHSPSREFYKLGFFSVKGFTNAFGDNVSMAAKAGRSIAESAKTGLSKALSKVRDIVENGIDSQPTIRPVLDLSAVTDGAGAINGMFNMTPSVGVMSNIRAINSMMNSQNGMSNDDVVSAIEKLGQKIGNMSGDTYSFGNVSYQDDTAVSNAVKSIVRAVKIERRT